MRTRRVLSRTPQRSPFCRRQTKGSPVATTAAAKAGHLAGSLLLAVLIVPLTAALAGERERDQPAEIQADRAEIDREAGVAHYFGNVVFTQGSLRITGARITVRAPQGQLRQAQSNGTPATLRRRTESGRIVRARARHIRYDAAKPLVTLSGEAEMVRGSERFDAARIEYHPDSGRIEATGGQNGRVRIRMTPSGDDSTSGGDD